MHLREALINYALVWQVHSISHLSVSSTRRREAKLCFLRMIARLIDLLARLQQLQRLEVYTLLWLWLVVHACLAHLICKSCSCWWLTQDVIDKTAWSFRAGWMFKGWRCIMASTAAVDLASNWFELMVWTEEQLPTIGGLDGCVTIVPEQLLSSTWWYIDADRAIVE